jgi:hypothetical protein
MDVIYRLADDLQTRNAMQATSLKVDAPPGVGLSQTHGLVCSAEWWSNIQTGALKTHTARGVIRGIWFGQWYEGPASFQMELSDRTLFGGHCYLEPEDADQVFTLGRVAEVDYVHQVLKANAEGVEASCDVWLEIRLGETSPSPVSPLPYTSENFGRFARLRNSRGLQENHLDEKGPWWAFWR